MVPKPEGSTRQAGDQKEGAIRQAGDAVSGGGEEAFRIPRRGVKI